METRRMKDYDEAIRSALTSVKTATTIPVTMYGQVLQDRRVKITHWIGLRTAALPRWASLLGYAVALLLLIAADAQKWVQLLFPAWVLLVSVVILVTRPPARDAEPG